MTPRQTFHLADAGMSVKCSIVMAYPGEEEGLPLQNAAILQAELQATVMI